MKTELLGQAYDLLQEIKEKEGYYLSITIKMEISKMLEKINEEIYSEL